MACFHRSQLGKVRDAYARCSRASFCSPSRGVIVTRHWVANRPLLGWHVPLSGEIGSGAVALGPPRPPLSPTLG
eukprot:1309030-Pleurochrysis_carterae.AAC.1